MFQYSKEQILLIITLIFGNVLCALCYALQAPFFPREAENKGATPAQYGLVFGIFELVMLIMSPIWGSYVGEIGPKFMATAGLFLTGGACILFGQLDKFIYTDTFLGFAFATRIVESAGNGAYFISFFSFIAMAFPENPGSVFAILETFYGLGMILGPTAGGALYTLGGFSLPFTVIGLMLIMTSILAYFCLPSDKKNAICRASFVSALKIKSIAIMGLAIAATTYGLGCIAVGLEPHLRPLGFGAFKVGLIFVTYGGMYAITAPLWGKVIDKFLAPNIAIISGELLMAVSFILLGPSPIIPLQPTVWLIIVSLLIQGLGMGGVLVGTYVGAQRDAITHGMPDNISTFGIISGFWICALSLGAFVGPSISGYVIEVAGFQWATQVSAVIHLITVVPFICMEAYYRTKIKGKRVERTLAKVSSSLYGSFDNRQSEASEQVILIQN